jgi:outer membrane protein OmpA-like peptidoglycan-associated protein
MLPIALAFAALEPASAVAENSKERPEQKLPPLEVVLDKAKVDLERHRLELRMSRKAGHVEIKVWDASGLLLAEEDHDFDGRPANSTLVVTWSPRTAEPVAKIEVYAHDAEGYYKGIAIIPWSLEIPHEEVNFETNSDAIRPGEEPKLAASLELIRAAIAEHQDLGPITLFIAGHTDTRGSADHNLDLSRRRARAIGRWFKSHAVGVPVAYEGFGENSLKVKTADEVDEERNRRVDYVLSIEAPRLKSSGAAAAWKRL